MRGCGCVWSHATCIGSGTDHYYNPPNFNASMQLSSRFKDIRRLHIGGMLTEFDINNFGPAGSADMLYTMEQGDE